MNTNVITELAAIAKQPTNKIVELPKARHAIQQTETYKKLNQEREIGAKGFKIIDPIAFNKTYHDRTLDLILPVFGFFNVALKPEIRFNFMLDQNNNVFERYHDNWGLDFRIVNVINIGEASLNSGMGQQSFQPTSNRLPDYSIAAIEPSQLRKFFVTPPPLPKAKNQPIKRTLLTLSAKLAHVIPENILKQIDEHTEKKTFNAGLFICAEMTDAWVMEQREVTMRPDPLLIGVELINNVYTYFLVDQFDLSMAENYIVDEFAL